ncbi:MAG: hypothetical protein AB2L14_07010 [Candidatus Xenobiia bacterium LiM19]
MKISIISTGVLLFIVTALLLNGCGGGSSSGDNPNPISSPVTGPYIYNYTSTDADNHNHTARLYSNDLSTPPAAGVSDTSSTVLDHSHSIAVTQAQCTSINNGSQITISMASATNPNTGVSHTHNVTLLKQFTQASSLSEDHTHNITITSSDLANPPLQGVAYTTTQALNHTHTVTLTQQQLMDLNANLMVNSVNSTYTSNPVTGINHFHTWVVLTKPL